MRKRSVILSLFIFSVFLLLWVTWGITYKRALPSRELNSRYESLLDYASAEGLKNQIHFRSPKRDERIPLNSLILTDKASEIILRYEIKREIKDLSESIVMKRLETALKLGPIKASSGKYYQWISEETCYILRDTSQTSFLRDFEIFVDEFSGGVYISTDTGTISKLLPGVPVMVFSGKRKAPDGIVSMKEGYLKPNLLGLGFNEKPVSINGLTGGKVSHVIENSKAREAGLMPGDIIVEVNGQTFRDIDELLSLLEEAKRRKDVELTIYRNRKTLKLVILLSEKSGRNPGT